MRVAICVLLSITACKSRESTSQEPPSSLEATRSAQPPQRCMPGDKAVCVGDAIVECGGDGTIKETCKDGCKRGACVDPCALTGVELIYVVDDNNNLLSFDPQRLPGDPFHRIGKLTCETMSTPFSMAVDRRGLAWVLYQSGKIYRVSIVDANCSPAGHTPTPEAPQTFGMGFASDGPKSTTEKLYVAANDDSAMLAQLDVSQAPPRWTPIGKITAGQSRSPELTGTADGALFGYFPESVQGGFVQQLDAATGKPIGERKNLAASLTSSIDSWAFAHWGGVFYVFATAGHNSAVHTVNRKTGKYELIRENLPYHIVGAGVSTCAPELERAL